MFKLRDYQIKAVEKGVEVLSSKYSCKEVLVLPTGAGKSIIISEIANRLEGNVLVVQPSKELLAQNISKLRSIGGEASIYSASFNSKEIGKITYATIGSLNVEEFKGKNIKYVLQDEAHLCTQEGSKLIKFIKDLKIDNLLGLTATPLYLKNTLEGAQLKIMTRVKGKLYNGICHVTQIRELVDNNYWSKLEYEVIDNSNKSLEFNSSGSDYTLKSIQINYEENKIAEKIKNKVATLTDRKSILIFVPTIEDAEKLKKTIPNSDVVHSKIKDKDRDIIIENFKSFKIRVVINVNVLAVGFDHPALDCIITGRPTTSIAMYYQQLGRGCRIHPDKDYCKIIDYSGNVSKFGALEDLNFEDVKNFGWGMFNKNVLLTNVAMWQEGKPTKEQLIAGKKVKSVMEIPYGIKNKETLNTKDPVFYFGKFKNKKVSLVFKENKSYLTWLLNQKDFSWHGEKGKNLKWCIQKSLGAS